MTERLIPRWAILIIWGPALLLIAATLIPLLVTNAWWVQIFVFPQIQIAVLLVLVAIAAAFVLNLRRSGSKALVAVLVAALIYQAQYLVLYTPVYPQEVRTADECKPSQRVRVLVLNVLKDNSHHERVKELVLASGADLFLALETDFRWADALEPLRQQYPEVVAAPRDDAWGMMLFSRLPLVGSEVRYLVDDYVPSIRSNVRLPGGAHFLFYGLHPKPPLMHSTARGDAELMRAGREIRRTDATAILAGDLNDVPWSRTTDLFHEVSGMRDPRVGRTFLNSFKTDNPIARWPLDHIFVTPAFELIGLKRLPDVGSDHFPILADLCHMQGTRMAPIDNEVGQRVREVVESGSEAADGVVRPNASVGKER